MCPQKSHVISFCAGWVPFLTISNVFADVLFLWSHQNL
ncbi:hypothetical protein [Escherichia phage FL12]